MRVIEDVLWHGKKAIMMVPEISLTKQITDRFDVLTQPLS